MGTTRTKNCELPNAAFISSKICWLLPCVLDYLHWNCMIDSPKLLLVQNLKDMCAASNCIMVFYNISCCLVCGAAISGTTLSLCDSVLPHSNYIFTIWWLLVWCQVAIHGTRWLGQCCSYTTACQKWFYTFWLGGMLYCCLHFSFKVFTEYNTLCLSKMWFYMVRPYYYFEK